MPVIGEGVYIAPNATVIGDARIGNQSSVWFSAVVRADYGPVSIGQGCSIQDNAVVHVKHTPEGEVYATTIEDDCVIGHGAVVEGCHIGCGCLVGMNAVVLPRAKIGEGCVIAAGAVVKEGAVVPDYSLLAGVPAEVKRTFKGPNPDIAWAAAQYRELSKQYLEE